MSSSKALQKNILKHFTPEYFAKKSFLSFCRYMNPNFMVAEHHRLIAKELHKITADNPVRLIINMPPRHGKSFLCSQYFPAWYLGNNPDHYIISASYGQDLANDFGRNVRNLIKSEPFNNIFEGVMVSDDSKSQKRFNTNKGGSYFAVGRGGSITGRGGHVVIIDDLLKNEVEARSELIRSAMKDWYRSTLYTRLMPGGSIIIINTRWHVDDLSGWLISESNDDWQVLDLPAIDSDNKPLWPEFYNLEMLESIRKEIGSQAFEALYQQSPILDGGNIIKRDSIRIEKSWPNCKQYIQSWDLTFKGNKSSDYVVGQVWGQFGSDYHLIDQVRGQWDFVRTLSEIRKLTNRYPKALTKLIEDKANGPAVIASLKKEIPGIIPINPKAGKVERLHMVSPLFEAGNVVISEDLQGLDDFISETISFPNSKHDDQVDAMTQALQYLFSKQGQTFATSGRSMIGRETSEPSIFNIK